MRVRVCVCILKCNRCAKLMRPLNCIACAKCKAHFPLSEGSQAACRGLCVRVRVCEYVCVCICVCLAAAAVSVSDCIRCYRPQLVCVAFAANLCVNKHESRCINAHTKANSAVPPALYSSAPLSSSPVLPLLSFLHIAKESPTTSTRI